MSQQSLERFKPKPMTALERELWKQFRCRLAVELKAVFSSDDFRLAGFDRFMQDTQHEIGSLFQKLEHYGAIMEVGRVRSVIPSNHGREIRQYKVKE